MRSSVAPPSVAPARTSLVDVLRTRAHEQGADLAIRFLVDGEHQEETIGFAELDRRARAAAATVQARCAPGSRAILLYPPGPEFVVAFFACLYAGVVAVPAYPPDPTRLARTLPRLVGIALDARADLLLTTSVIAGVRDVLTAGAPDLARLTWLPTDETPDGAEAHWRDPGVGPDDLAFVQYTSGSTGTPKGVLLSHANLLANSAAIDTAFAAARTGGHEPPSAVIWLPPYHDMGLIGGLLQPVYAGFPVVLMSPMHMLQRPLRWLEAMSRYRATISGGPNFAYELCVRKSTPEQRAALDLSRWELAFNGAEQIRPDTLRRFAAAFAPAGFDPTAFYPCYGLAEATLLVTGAARRRPTPVRSFDRAALQEGTAHATGPVRTVCAPAGTTADATPTPGDVDIVSVGTACADTSVAIHDPATGVALDPGRVGEVWVRGPAVTAGYWRRPALSAQVLVEGADGPWLRTGDLAAVVDGELYITGRAKDVVVIQGRNHHPHDIETSAEAASELLRPGSGAAFGVDTDGRERLVLAYEVRPAAAAAQLAAAVAGVRAAIVAEHGVAVDEVVLLRPGTVPKTSSGKIQRSATRARYLAGELDAVPVAPTDHGTRADDPDRPDADSATGPLRDLLAGLLGVAPDTLDVDRPVVGFGLDSLTAVEFAHLVERELGRELTAAALLDGASLRDVATLLRTAAPTGTEPCVPDAEYPAGSGQCSLWFLDRLGDGERYHVAWAARFSRRFDDTALRAAFDRLVRRHPTLRTGYVERGAQLWATPHPHAADVEVVDAAGLSDTTLADRVSDAAQVPFDLEAGQVLRVRVFRHDHDDVLLVAAHHIAVDFWSLMIMLGELRELYAGAGEPSGPGGSYPRHAAREHRYLAGPDAEADARHWRSVVGRPVPGLGLPAGTGGHPRGQTLPLRLPREVTDLVRAAASAALTTPFVLFAAALSAALAERTGVRDVVLATPSAGRSAAADHDVVGYFVNTVLLRTGPAEPGPTPAHVGRMRDAVLAAMRHARTPFARIAELAPPDRDGTAQLAQAMIVFEGTRPGVDAVPPGLALGLPPASCGFADGVLHAFPLRAAPPPFDLVLVLAEDADEIAGTWHVDAAAVAVDAVADLNQRYLDLLTTTARALIAPDRA